MKKLQYLLSAAMILYSFGLFAQKGVERTITTSLQYEAETNLLIDLKGTVEVKAWDKDFIGVVMNISTNLEHEETLDLLISNDRYFVDKEVDAFNTTILKSPYRQKMVTINHKALEEDIRYILFVPTETRVQILDEETDVIAQDNTGEPLNGNEK